MNSYTDFCSFLGVSPDASEDEVKKAYRKMAMRWHPDRHIGESEERQRYASEQFRLAKEAYDAIMNGFYDGDCYGYEEESCGDDFGYPGNQQDGYDTYNHQQASYGSGTGVYADGTDDPGIFRDILTIVGYLILVGLGVTLAVGFVIVAVKIVAFLIRIAVPLAIVAGSVYLFRLLY